MSRAGALAGHARPGLGVDGGAALRLVGAELAFLGPTFLLPAIAAVGYGQPFWPFRAAGAITSGAGLATTHIAGDASEPGSDRSSSSSTPA